MIDLEERERGRESISVLTLSEMPTAVYRLHRQHPNWNGRHKGRI